MYWIKNGGILMYFILAMSIIGLAVVIERFIYCIQNKLVFLLYNFSID